MSTSYLNHYLHIDLNRGEWTPFSLPQDVLTQYVGGKGVGAYLLAQHQDPKAEPFDPSNPLIFIMGPLTGTQAPSMRSGVIFQSPVTRLFTDSYYGGFFGQELRSAVNMVLGLRYAPARYLESNLLTAVGAAEVLHRANARTGVRILAGVGLEQADQFLREELERRHEGLKVGVWRRKHR